MLTNDLHPASHARTGMCAKTHAANGNAEECRPNRLLSSGVFVTPQTPNSFQVCFSAAQLP